MSVTGTALLALLAPGVWLYLFFAHGRFWASGPELLPGTSRELPDVDIVIPARDEAETIARVIASLLAQDYAGRFRILLIDDGSADGTARLAQNAHLGGAAHLSGRTGLSDSAVGLEVHTGLPKPQAWSGKLWALSQGIALSSAPVLLLTDADIVHDPRHLATLVARLEAPNPVDMVSEMVRLNCSSLAERSLVPAFIYFFQMLYPFAKVNDPLSRVAAAAGGTVLIRRTALQRIGGIEVIKGALIDDVSLAQAVKQAGAVYLGHSRLAHSIRRYPHFSDVWGMIERTAFTQLRHSTPLLAATLLGLTLVWWVPVFDALLAHGWERLCGMVACILAAISFTPTLARYQRSPLWSLALPLIAFFFMAATLSSAICFWRGRGARWKGRVYKDVG